MPTPPAVWYADPYWWTQAAIAFGTIGAIVVALFIDRIKRLLWPPKLQLALKSESGELTPVSLRDPTNGEVKEGRGRYYHLSVKNNGSVAHNTAVYLTAVMTRQANGWRNVWTGDVPLAWRHAEIYPLWRDIGASAVDADLLELVANKWLELRAVIKPHALPYNTVEPYGPTPGRWRAAIEFILRVQVKSTDGESPPTLFHVTWNGQWAEGDAEITRCLYIKAIDDPGQT